MPPRPDIDGRSRRGGFNICTEKTQGIGSSTAGRVDVLINNVGAGVRYTDFENLSVAEIMAGIVINLHTVLFGCKAVLPVMKRQLSGHIINTTSILGKRARAGLSVYTAGKHGVDGFSRSLFNEVIKLQN
jgi:3alpha(or 20beta)-hydroxysteroid dehydrogenase